MSEQNDTIDDGDDLENDGRVNYRKTPSWRSECGTVHLYCGDCLEVLPTLEAGSVDAVVTDPPYGLSFMGKHWDHGIPGEQFWREVIRVAKPGCHLLAFGGTRTYHRLACAIEDAGWEIRDCVMWVYGSGFPKSHDVSKAIDKRKDWKALAELGKAIKAARVAAGLSQTEAARLVGLIGADESLGGGGFMWFETGRLPTRAEWPLLKHALQLGDDFDAAFEEAEREVIGDRKMRDTSEVRLAVAANAGGYDASARRVVDITAPATDAARQWSGWGTALKPAWEPIILARKPLVGTVAANVLEHGAGAINVDGCRVPLDGDYKCKANGRPSQTGLGDNYNPSAANQADTVGRWPANFIHDGGDEVLDVLGEQSRFFYSAKASKADRDEGCDGMPIVTADPYGQHRGRRMQDNDVRFDGKPPSRGRNTHPTVKPTDLMRYLCRLVTPPGGMVLDPFMGSGSTGKAARLEGFRFVGIEREAEYHELARRRIEGELKRFPLFEKAEGAKQATLFGDDND